MNTLWEQYCRKELPLKEISKQYAYLVYAKNWIPPRSGNLFLEDSRCFRLFGWEENANREGYKSYWTQTDPDFLSGFSVNHSKEWRGRRDSNPRPLP